MKSPRVACVHAPELGLQIVLRDRPAWKKLPVALVVEDRPDAPLVALNAHARDAGLTPGTRHGAARNLVPALRTAVIPVSRERETATELTDILRRFSPRVEPDEPHPGLFTVDATGMGTLYRSPRSWASAVRRAIYVRGIVTVVVVGFQRERVTAIARHARGVAVLRSPHEERARAGAVPLAVLDLPVRVWHDLAALDVLTLGDLWALPPETVRLRFGDESARLRTWAEDTITLPVQPEIPREPVRAVIEVEPPDDDLARLLFALRGSLHLLVARLSSRGESVAALSLTLALDDHTQRAHRIEAASPTRDVTLLVELARLRLANDPLSAPVKELDVVVDPAPVRGEQLALFAHDRARDRGAADRALARVRAAFGEESVTRAKLRDAHLPEAGFRWEPTAHPPPSTTPLPVSLETPSPLVRRLVIPPRELSRDELIELQPVEGARRETESAWRVAVAANDAHENRWLHATPSRVSGGWWVRTVERDYFYAQKPDGALWWLFFDRARRRWFLHGVVD